jgi:hypothetical protein
VKRNLVQDADLTRPNGVGPDHGEQQHQQQQQQQQQPGSAGVSLHTLLPYEEPANEATVWKFRQQERQYPS